MSDSSNYINMIDAEQFIEEFTQGLLYRLSAVQKEISWYFIATIIP